MRKLKAVWALPLSLLLAAASGCTPQTYGFYTNIPESEYEVCSNRFTSLGGIGGYINENVQYGETDTTEYTSRSRSYYSMMSPAELIVADNFNLDGADDKFTTFTGAVSNLLNAIDQSISVSVSNSDICKFNNAEAGEKIEITQITYEVLGIAKRVYEKTDCYYNPALFYNIEAYCFGNRQVYPKYSSQLPTDAEISAYTDLASHFGDITLEHVNGRYYVTKPGYAVEWAGETLSMKLDLGGIGKGYAVDRIDGIFEDFGYKFGYFNFGSSSMLVKSNVRDGNYNLYFSSPRATEDDSLGYVRIKARNEKISTSGDNEKYYVLDGKRYCHIIDPTTGKPVQTGIMSVTIVGGGAAEDDAFTTAIMAMGKDRAVSFIENVLTDRKVIFTCE